MAIVENSMLSTTYLFSWVYYIYILSTIGISNIMFSNPVHVANSPAEMKMKEANKSLEFLLLLLLYRRAKPK